MLMLPLIVLPALALGLGYVRLLHGPVSLKILNHAIERGIEAELPGLVVRIEDVAVGLTPSGGFEFKILDLRLSDPDGGPVASAPSARVELSAPALRALRIVPSRVELIAPRLSVSMSEDGRVSLSFAHATNGDGTAQAPVAGPTGQSGQTGMGSSIPQSPQTFDLARLLAQTSARARQQLGASSYLRVIGVKDATVVFEQGGHRSQWLVPEIAIDLLHKRARSVISGSAVIASEHGPWSLAFHTEEQESTRRLSIKTSVRDLVPGALADLPGLAPLRMFEMPVAGDSSFDLTSEGELAGAELALQLGEGHLALPAMPGTGLGLDAGLVALHYDGVSHQLVLKPSTFIAGRNRATLVGEAVREGSAWRFAIRSQDGSLSVDDRSTTPAVPLDGMSLAGRYGPDLGLVELEGLSVKAGGGEVELRGEVLTGAASSGARLEGTISPMALETMMVIWPRALAPVARTWVADHAKGTIRAGTWSWAFGDYFKERLPAAGSPAYRLSMALETADVRLMAAPGMPPIEAPRALTRVENGVLEVNVPDAAFVLSPTRRVPLKGVRFTSANAEAEVPGGEVTFRIQSALGPVLELLDRPPVELSKQAGMALDGLDGKIDGQFKVAVQLVGQTIEPRVEGKARLTDGRAKPSSGLDVQGATIAFDITDKAIEAKGELLVNAVPAKLSWQHILDAPADKQPPLRITAQLDAADRNQLGLDLNHLVRGDVPVEMTVNRVPGSEPVVRLRAELTNAELALDAIAWHKQPGRSASLQCDIARGRTHKFDLQNLRIAGDDIAVEGTASIGADNRVVEFSFPVFSLNVVSRLEVQGVVKNDIVKLTVHASTFDGRDFFRNLFTVGPDRTIKPLRPHAGIDFYGEIDTLIGFSETAMRGVKITLTERAEKLSSLDVQGKLAGGKPVTLTLTAKPGEPRKLLADTADAGQAFKLTGFYPNVQGGRVRLEVNVDGRGPAEKTGILLVENFRVLGDPVVSEVVSFGDSTRTSPQPGSAEHRARADRTKVTREVFDFDSMRAPFSIGHGQFVLEQSFLHGPLLGASLRGKVDYNLKIVNLGGTYVPLQGLNNVFGGIPVLGQLLSGPRGEGIFGITFAIQGPMAQPQVIVNPFSMVAPGVLREIFQMSDPDTQVAPRAEKRWPVPVEKRVRASSAPPSLQKGSTGAGGPARPAETIDGWTQQAPPAGAPGPRR